VFHQAAMGSVPRSIEIPAVYHEVNVGGTLRVLEAARRHGVRRVVYAASSSAYGNTVVLPKVESMRPDPLSPYASPSSPASS
jgi:UDP-glucose 4-epimerase